MIPRDSSSLPRGYSAGGVEPIGSASGPFYSEVKPETHGFRDERISRRHREYGWNCPAVDLDFCLVEYNFGKPVALVEYKHHNASTPVLKHPTYRALRDLADKYSDGALPFFIAFYWPDIWAYKILPVNHAAMQHFTDFEVITEREYVKRLYRMRRLTVALELLPKLKTELPEAA
jgi:hypothetical protein